ncbi:molybdopterin biosynthesis protein [Aliidongia dinghuensis]|uniref:Molybdopterin-synthase adenylyltransferase n=1 Tax=Aliidongia dinghuensis TaxID=1867774 RepID=A0A8J2YQY7_9PROT|nr:molybdopterin-synthase adenylyltransferase MoeB [Aliidongia dinghuensis]GGF07476.1 molybdopterin biosynthesis protein [Aliidongia dinghuensis]
MRDLDDAEFERYARHLILDEVGEEGQAKLLESRVLVIGAGGLGAPVLLYLAAAGVGTLGIVDDDAVSLSNLQRQVIHRTDTVGRRKTDSAAEGLKAIEPAVKLELFPERLTAENVDDLVGRYDLVADGSDNFTTRYLVNDACVRAKKPFVSGALLRFEGQLSTYKPHAGPEHPCYRCLFPEPPPPDSIPRCEEAGILGPVAGVIGTLQATEVLKELLGIGESLSGRLVMYDALGTSFYTVKVPRDPNCPCCGAGAS